MFWKQYQEPPKLQNLSIKCLQKSGSCFTDTNVMDMTSRSMGGYVGCSGQLWKQHVQFSLGPSLDQFNFEMKFSPARSWKYQRGSQAIPLSLFPQSPSFGACWSSSQLRRWCWTMWKLSPWWRYSKNNMPAPGLSNGNFDSPVNSTWFFSHSIIRGNDPLERLGWVLRCQHIIPCLPSRHFVPVDGMAGCCSLAKQTKSLETLWSLRCKRFVSICVLLQFPCTLKLIALISTWLKVTTPVQTIKDEIEPTPLDWHNFRTCKHNDDGQDPADHRPSSAVRALGASPVGVLWTIATRNSLRISATSSGLAT